MSKRIRITLKRRTEIDMDKLVFALLRAIEEQRPRADTEPGTSAGGGASRSGEESAA